MVGNAAMALAALLDPRWSLEYARAMSFSEVRITPVQHLRPSLAEIGLESLRDDESAPRRESKLVVH
jgi:hypothetical protein